MMPVREGRVYSFGELDKTTFKGLPGMLADSLPDTYGRALFEKWLALTGRTSGNAIGTLCFLGKRCMGALEFEPAIDAVDTDIRIEVDSLVDVAREALADKSFSHLVRECGIDMAECSLIEENGRAHFLTKRFDRINGAKVHMQTLCGIAHFDYRLLRAYSYEQAFAAMRGLRLTYKEAQEMFRRMVFNVVVRN